MRVQQVVIWAGLMLSLIPRWSFGGPIEQGRDGNIVWVSNPQLRISVNLATGCYNCNWADQTTLLSVACGAKLSDGTELAASSCPAHVCDASDIQPFSDPLGAGLQITVHHRKADGPELRQCIDVYEHQRAFVTSVQIVSPVVAASNRIEVLTTQSGIRLPVAGKPKVLGVPFDNDGYVRYNYKHDPAKDPDSYEVSAMYDNTTRRGVVVGSITHDLWKSGIEAGEVSDGVVGRVTVYCGATGTLSRDTQPHGMVSGTTISSPRIWVGSFSDWRDGLEAFGEANAMIRPPLAWKGGVIFGWNSWAAYRDKISYADYVAASDFLSRKLQPAGFQNNNTVYINWDSFWTNCSDEEMRQAARHAHANGQKAGIYWTPFTAWKPNPDNPVEGTNGKYHYRDILLRDNAGNILPEIDGGQPLDLTHPATLRRIDWQLARFVDWGYDFVKLDFMNSGTIEGKHFDPAITTGVAAYNLGMQRIVADLDPAIIGRPFFISLSIAPLFPAGYAHGRRISCDCFGTLRDSEYMLNSLTYGWWINRNLCEFNDPDHTVLTSLTSPTTLEEARTRLNASIIAGTMLIDSDDLTNPAAQERAVQLLSNPRINALAKSGHAFRPVEGDSGNRAAETFVWKQTEDLCYVAVFNFDSKKSVSRNIDLDRLGLSTSVSYRVQDVWDGKTEKAQGLLKIELPARASKILCIRPE